MSDTVTLHCQEGNHDWERPKQRGKRPFNCPEHSVVKETSGLTRQQSTARAREARAEAAEAQTSWERENLYPHVKGNDGNYSFEAPRVLAFTDKRLAEYAQRRLAVEGEDALRNVDADIAMLTETRDRILKRVRARFGTGPVTA